MTGIREPRGRCQRPWLRYHETRKVTTVPRPIQVRALPHYRLWLRYDDGAEGEVDLSSLVERGVFQRLKEIVLFEAVQLGPYGEIAWGEDLDLCPDAMYMRLTGKTPDQVFQGLSRVNA
jgi:hypothetical protein